MKRRRTIFEVISDFLVGVLVKEHRGYHQRFPNDVARLRAILRPGDVVLVEGSQRISEVIKYLTQSSWSHAALYVGDSLIKRSPHQAYEARQRFGDEAESLLVEATVEEGVAAAPLSKYVNHNIRICRPINLRPGDLNTVLGTVISQLGNPYNRDHILSLLWYFLPVELLPKGWRHRALERSGRLSKDVICSTQIAMAFQKVRYPIQPLITARNGAVVRQGRLPGWLLFSRRSAHYDVFETGVFTPCDPSLVTPRDFDLSPYFEVVKLGTSDKRAFDYKKIKWSAADLTTDALSNGAAPAPGPADRRDPPAIKPT